MNKQIVTGYETYSEAERAQLIKDFRDQIKSETPASKGEGLRAEVARANIREFNRQIVKILDTK